MTEVGEARRISDLLNALSWDLQELRKVGGALPAVERNAVRMQGTLRALQVQFGDLELFEEHKG